MNLACSVDTRIVTDAKLRADLAGRMARTGTLPGYG